ncbi:MAG: hypothetical protein Q7R39_15775, partial [Dehalococcoidia bacterium]|nr:hypothetical protein [Dehalococcoidia bacterium]
MNGNANVTWEEPSAIFWETYEYVRSGFSYSEDGSERVPIAKTNQMLRLRRMDPSSSYGQSEKLAAQQFPKDYREKLAFLREQVRKFRVPYQSKGLGSDKDGLHKHLHAAAALALWAKFWDGSYTEEVRENFDDAWRNVLYLLPNKGQYDNAKWPIYEEEGLYGWLSSLVATSVVVLVELTRTYTHDGDYETAFHMLAMAVHNCSRITKDIMEADDEGLGPLDWAEKLRGYDHPINVLDILDISRGEAIGLFEQLQATRGTDIHTNWGAIANDCAVIGEHWEECSWVYYWDDTLQDARESYLELVDEDSEPIVDPGGKQVAWRDYWLEARGYALARLEPSQMRTLFQELMQSREGNRSEEILRAFFFIDFSLDDLPPNARQALVNAISTWTWPEGRRLGAVLNEFRFIAEVLLYKALWLPLVRILDSTGDSRLVRLRALREIAEGKSQRG